MIGKIHWNLIIGLVAMSLTFIFSIKNNLFLTSLIRSSYSFSFAFGLGFFLRWILGTVVGIKNMNFEEHSTSNNSLSDIGNNLDLTTPDEDEALHRLIKENLEQKDGEVDFLPLNPPKLVSKEKIDPEDLAKVLRHLSEE